MKTENKSKKDNLTGLYLLFGITFIIWVVSMFFLKWQFKTWSLRASFGDSFGAINSLFSGLALGGIIYTIFLQKKELSLQRDELKDTRKEFVIQNKTLMLQRFENTFFNLLSLHHQIVESIDLDIHIERRIDNLSMAKRINAPREFDRITLKGRDVFKKKYEEMIVDFSNENDINTKYLDFYDKVQTDFGHYFRNLYRIIKLVDETEFHTHKELGTSADATTYLGMISYSNPNHNTKYKYTSIIRSQLSDYELLWVFYNCLSENGIKKFKPLVEQYSLLKNLPQDKLHNSKIVNNYKDSAFKKIN